MGAWRIQDKRKWSESGRGKLIWFKHIQVWHLEVYNFFIIKQTKVYYYLRRLIESIQNVYNVPQKLHLPYYPALPHIVSMRIVPFSLPRVGQCPHFVRGPKGVHGWESWSGNEVKLTAGVILDSQEQGFNQGNWLVGADLGDCDEGGLVTVHASSLVNRESILHAALGTYSGGSVLEC